MSSSQIRRRPTIHDVARAAGVSITTVSHTLNDKGVVATATRQRVRDAATELGYSPDAIARGLRSNRLGVLGLVIRPLDDLDSYQPEGVDYFMRFAGAAAVEALDRGYGLMLVRDPSTPDAPQIALALDGFIIADPVASDPVIALLNRLGTPLVAVGRDIERPEFRDWVADSHDIGSVLSHVQEQGAETVALVRGTDANAWNADNESEYRQWARESNQTAIVYSKDERSGEAGGREVAESMLNFGGPLPDAVYCLTGRHAAGLQRRLQKAGFSVPDQVMVVAGSDSEQTRNSTPPITSVDLQPEASAKAAVGFLLARLEGNENGPAPIVENKLIVRGSTTR
ncbi:LacI family DNA-binding transcriptional regulator [Homoserinimonas sp. OAct 916]|uniref:LacI family DNA-binding transcriptional regulator n=1 Tax=Homoserinimonas sp. OAct 916 TaxID=2211450 RepID=UPI000DBE87D2|nr:LacI family DNA-binding transcriptional regulator [Homoserinimonas sp. OAct 916]